ncbi:MAG TPA: PAS domain S-box protein [archaeon]|nr:PAS domain S-box protein [archaeon]
MDDLKEISRLVRKSVNSEKNGAPADGTVFDNETIMLRAGIEKSIEVIFICDLSGAITYANPAFEWVYGYTKEETLGKTPRIIKSGKLSAEAYKAFWEKILAGETTSGEMINKTKDGRYITVEGSVNPITVGNKIIGFLAIQSDITERKVTEDALKKKNDELERFIKIAIGRELKMIELKKRIRELEERR